ncbi:MAG: chemotaxis-specific protein-glutamate methyltransferase CheB [Acidobacteriota bacterium]
MPRREGPIRVLVVDDSEFVREAVSAVLSADPELAVAGHAANGLEAVAKAASLKPDIITMDIEMPVMDGLAAIESIMANTPAPILVLTSHTGVKVAFAAVSRGALDVMEKPDLDMENDAKLIKKVKLLARVDIAAYQQAMGMVAAPSTREPRPSSPAGGRQTPSPAGLPSPAPAGQPAPGGGTAKRIVAIAASTGGPKALEEVLSPLPADFPLPLVISQHIADGFTKGMAEWLNSVTPITVAEARHGDILKPGHAYLNPCEHSMGLTPQGMVLLRPRDQRSFYHPSCNDMLASVAGSYGAGAVGVILTGMGDDGVEGMKAIKTAGGATIAQDEKTSIIYGMNGLAVKHGYIDKVMALADIPTQLLRLAAYGR